MKKIVIALLCYGFSLAYAEPYMAVREGYKCSQCHVNRTGGGKRNDFGVIYSQTTLPFYKPVTKEDRAHIIQMLDSKINEHISVGGNLRLNHDSRIGNGQSANEFGIREGNFYFEAKLFEDYASLYFDETFAPGGASSREALILAQNLPLNAYVKAGRILVPYGFRILDDSSFIRQVTGFNYANQDLGFEFGIEPGWLSTYVAITNGTQGAAENNADKQVSSRAEAVFRYVRFGGSYSWNPSDIGTRTVYGGFAGGTLGRFTVLGEFDWLNDKDTAGLSVKQEIAFAELNFLAIRGLNVKLTYDFLDPDTSVGANEKNRWRVGLEAFWTQFLQTSLFYRFNSDIPQNPSGNADEILFQVHAFF